MEKLPCVYLLASKRNGTLYVGATSNLVKRVWEHKHDVVAGFTRQYGVYALVWCEGMKRCWAPFRARKQSRVGSGSGNWT